MTSFMWVSPLIQWYTHSYVYYTKHTEKSCVSDYWPGSDNKSGSIMRLQIPCETDGEIVNTGETYFNLQ